MLCRPVTTTADNEEEAFVLGEHRTDVLSLDVPSEVRSNAPDEAEAPLPDAIPVDRSDPRFETADDPRLPEGKLFFKIGEVSKITGLKPYVLRYWETEFPWIRPSKTSSRQRLYRRQDIAVLLQIKRLRYEEQQTIADTKELIRERRGHEKTPGKRTSRAPRKAVKALERSGAPVVTALGLGYSGPGVTADLGPMLAEMRRAVLDLLEAVED